MGDVDKSINFNTSPFKRDLLFAGGEVFLFFSCEITGLAKIKMNFRRFIHVEHFYLFLRYISQ